MTHIRALVDDPEAREDLQLSRGTLISELQFSLYDDFFSLTPYFTSSWLSVPTLKRLEPREVAHEMELHDLQTTPSLHQIFMNYVQGVGGFNFKNIGNKTALIKVTQSALARLKIYLQRELALMRTSLYINCLFKSLIKNFSIK